MSSLFTSIPAPPSQELVLGPLHFRMYGLCIALGALAAVSLARRRWEAVGADPEDITTVALVAVPSGLIGARLYHVITDWSGSYSGGRWWPGAFEIWKGGLGIPGGIILGTLAGALMARRLKMNWRYGLDAAAPALPLAQAIGRLGNWFNQELYGRPTNLPWGLTVEPAYRPADLAGSTTFHPTFAYEALWNLGLVAFIVLGGRRVVLRPGRWFPVYLIGYGIGRFWVELMRIDEATLILGLRVNTWFSGSLIVVGLVWLFWKGSPVDAAATAELRAGGNPRAHALEEDAHTEQPDESAEAEPEPVSDPVSESVSESVPDPLSKPMSEPVSEPEPEPGLSQE